MIPREWIPTFAGMGFLVLAGYGILFYTWFTERRRAKKAEVPKPGV